jgi:hexulose-6-phosphate isomerase
MTDRRTFLRASGVALAGLGLASTSGAASVRETPRFKKAVKIGMAPGKTVGEKFMAIKGAGFAGVDMDSPNAYAMGDVLKARDETGLEIHGCVCSTHWSSPLSSPDPEVAAKTVAGMKQALADCKAYGGTTVLLVPAVVNDKISYQDAYTRSQARLREILPVAEELGITVALENVWNNFLLSPIETARYIDEMESPRLGAYFDIGNVLRYGWPEHWIPVLGKRIVKLDVKEFDTKKMNDQGLYKGFDVKLGDGSVDWPAVVKALEAIGYTGYGTAEMPGGDEEYLKDLSARMDRCLGLA